MTHSRDKRYQRGFLALVFAALALVVLRIAWVCDDAYITFRTVDNFVSGFGPRWNVDERVQSYTHPLWMFLFSGFYFVTREAFYTSIAVTAALSLAAVLVFVRRIAPSPAAAAFGIAVLLGSKAFVEFATSGLEDALAYLLIALFLWKAFSADAPYRLRYLSLLSALVALNRLDHLLLVAPFLLGAALELPRKKAIEDLAIGFLPLLAWEIFSIVYYGLPLPNTYYAKIHTGVAAGTLAAHGVLYLVDSLNADSMSLPVIAALLALAGWKRRRADVLHAVGLSLYLVYVIRIGGDFMSGRFLAVPCFYATIVLSVRLDAILEARTPLPSLAVIAIGLTGKHPPLLSQRDADQPSYEASLSGHDIADERAYYLKISTLSAALAGQTMPLEPLVDDARKLAEDAVVEGRFVGIYGYFAPRTAHIVDVMALTDPLLSHLPCEPDWRIGHFPRKVPAGYLAGLARDQDLIEDPRLSAYYEHLSKVIRGPLFTADRWAAIWWLNTGASERLLRPTRRRRDLDRRAAH